MNSKAAKITLLVLRLVLGWLFLYSAVTKLADPSWTSAAYLESANTFTPFYHWLASSSVIPLVDALNVWGQLLLGISLVLGVGVRISATLGALLMLLYYFPILQFPYPDAHSYLVDEHIIIAAVLVFFVAVRAGRYWGIDALLAKKLDSRFVRTLV
ncbi:MAG: DoxX family protein [Candidatus Andersenbacteria bacterium]